MFEELFPHFYRIEVPLPGNPLRSLNSYYIKGDDRELLIDTGFDLPECRIALQDALTELHSDSSKRDILATHFHADHVSLAYHFVGKGRKILMGARDYDYIFRERRDLMEVNFLRFSKEGVSEDMIARMRRDTPTKQSPTFFLPPPAFSTLEDGETVEAGGYRFKVVLVPGHTPGNTMLYMEEQKTMLTGDHILFDITPNISAWPYVPDTLQDFLNSLEKARQYDVKSALPAHRKPGDYYERIDGLLLHHKRRIEDTLRIVRNDPGQTAECIAGRMSWRIRCDSWKEFPPAQKIFALGECLSHLDYLMGRELIEKKWNDSVYIYFPVNG